MLIIQDFKKSYNSSLILQFNELVLSNGIYWFKGQNGSGKSTLFKSIAGLQTCEGTITVDNVDLKKQPINFRKIVNYAEAEPMFPGFVTAKDLIRFVGKAKDSPRDQQEFYTKLFGIDSYFEKPCETFSSGMLKKLSLALAFLGKPRVVILDEPLITLDDVARDILLEHIHTWSSKTIFLLSSHQTLDDPDFAVNGVFKIENKSLVR